MGRVVRLMDEPQRATSRKQTGESAVSGAVFLAGCSVCNSRPRKRRRGIGGGMRETQHDVRAWVLPPPGMSPKAVRWYVCTFARTCVPVYACESAGGRVIRGRGRSCVLGR
jgi:hypothetical protein